MHVSLRRFCYCALARNHSHVCRLSNPEMNRNYICAKRKIRKVDLLFVFRVHRLHRWKPRNLREPRSQTPNRIQIIFDYILFVNKRKFSVRQKKGDESDANADCLCWGTWTMRMWANRWVACCYFHGCRRTDLKPDIIVTVVLFVLWRLTWAHELWRRMALWAPGRLNRMEESTDCRYRAGYSFVLHILHGEFIKQVNMN